MKKWKFLTAAALTLMLAACGSDEETSTSGDTNEPAQTQDTTENKETAATAVFPMTVSPLSTDSETEDGKSVTFEDVTFEEMPKNIVVFDYGFLDTLDALGVEGIVGIAANGGKGNFPEHLKEKYLTDSIADVGSLKAIDFEKVAAANPDAIFISGRQSAYYEELKEITPNVVFIGSDNEKYVDGVFETVDLAAKIFGKEYKAEELKTG